jgi:hypothetical protein
MAIDKKIKEKITEQWLNAFPQLSVFGQNKFYKIVGCCVIGIELIKLPRSEEYRPHFVIYPLWKNEIKKCLEAPILMKQIYNKKGLQFNIAYDKHTVFFDEAVECLKKQIPISLNGNVVLKSLFEFIGGLFNDILIKSNSAQQAKLFELEFYTALYTGSQTQIQNVLNQIQKESKGWNMKMFEIWFGKFDLWFNELKEKGNNRDLFLKQIETNKADDKIQQLKSSSLIM